MRAAVCLDARRTIGRRCHALANVAAALDDACVSAHARPERIEVLLRRRRAERRRRSCEARRVHRGVACDAGSAAATAARAGIFFRNHTVDAIAVLIDTITGGIGRSGMNCRVAVVAVAGDLVETVEILILIVAGRRAVTRHEGHGDKPTRRNSRDTFCQRTELRICFDVQRFRAAVRARSNVCGDEPFAVSASKKHG